MTAKRVTLNYDIGIDQATEIGRVWETRKVHAPVKDMQIHVT